MIRRYFGFTVIILTLGLGYGLPAFSTAHPGMFWGPDSLQSDADKLLGRWQTQSELGTFNLYFRSKSQMVFEGETFAYTLLPGVIRVQDGYETIDYGYQLRGSALIIVFPEGYQLQFSRLGPPSGGVPSLPADQEKSRSSADRNRERSARAEETRNVSSGAVNQASSSTVSSGEIGSVHWGFKGRPPLGWKFQQNQQGAVLGHDTIAGMILVIPHLAVSQSEVETNLRQGLVEEGIQLRLTGNLEAIGNGALAGGGGPFAEPGKRERLF